jgi:hypothetical protein
MTYIASVAAAILIWFAANVIANSYIVFNRDPKDKGVWVQQAVGFALIMLAAYMLRLEV